MRMQGFGLNRFFTIQGILAFVVFLELCHERLGSLHIIEAFGFRDVCRLVGLVARSGKVLKARVADKYR